MYNWKQCKTRLKHSIFTAPGPWKNPHTAKISLDFEKKFRMLIPVSFWKSHQVSWNLDELLTSYKTNYIIRRGGRFAPSPRPFRFK